MWKMRKPGFQSVRCWSASYTPVQKACIPVYTIFKNLTIILIAYGEVLWFGASVTTLSLISFIFMVISSIIAAWSDVSTALLETLPLIGSAVPFDFQAVKGIVQGLDLGYVWMLCNCMTSAAYVLAMRKRIKVTGFSDWDSMYYNNLLSIPILAIFSLIVEDWGTDNLSRNFPSETRNSLFFAIAFSGAATVGISYTTAWCIRTTSSTTYSMIGALNKLPVAACGMFFFGDPATIGSVLPIVVGFFAGVLYAVAKRNQDRGRRDQAGSTLPLSARR